MVTVQNPTQTPKPTPKPETKPTGISHGTTGNLILSCNRFCKLTVAMKNRNIVFTFKVNRTSVSKELNKRAHLLLI
ncbi:hypothetical protein J6TS2_51620 [Heyndrickxia sporothermodurans]|nr:hypothetical protein J6TS2_51620 [Heyndrickxia sporothermodurans]